MIKLDRVNMKPLTILILAFLLFSFPATVVWGQEDMCTSIQKHIKTAKSIGGVTKSNEKAGQVLQAYKYLARQISARDLLICLIEAGVDSGFVRTEAINAGMNKNDVEAALFQYNMTEAAIARAQLPQESEDKMDEPELDSILSLESVTKDTNGGVATGAGCNLVVSPWTWCVY